MTSESNCSAKRQFGWRFISLAPRFLASNKRLLNHFPTTLYSFRGILQLANGHMRPFIGGRVTSWFPLDLNDRPVEPRALPPSGLKLSKIVKIATSPFTGWRG